MKKICPTFFRSLALSGVLLVLSVSSYASHILGAELRYKCITGLTYEVTVYLYGDCGSTTGAFNSLPICQPQICVYNGSVSVATLTLVPDTPVCGNEVSRVCPDSATTCTSLASIIRGVKKFSYSATYTFPSSQQYWRLVYSGTNTGSGTVSCSFFSGIVGASSSGRTAAITNIATGGGSDLMQLIDTLNTTTSRGHNSNPVFSTDPLPFYCAFTEDCYNPGASDIYDTSTLYGEPAGDSLVFALVSATNGTGTCGATGTDATYIITDAWTTPTIQPMDGAHPIQCATGTSFSFNTSTGEVCFEPINQRSTVDYNVEEYFHDTLTGTMQLEMNFYTILCDSVPCSGFTETTKVTTPPATQQITQIYPNPANTELTISSGENITCISISNILGQTIYSKDYHAQNVQVDVADLPNGIYYIKINGTEVKKFLKE